MSATKKPYRPQLDALEDRSLMASGISATFSQGVLSVMGSSFSDRIAVREIGGRVSVDGFSGSILATQIRGIRVDGGHGDDAITLALSRATALKTSVFGGTGTDTLVASSAALPQWRDSLERYLDSGRFTSERNSVDQAYRRSGHEFQHGGSAETSILPGTSATGK